MQPIDAYGFFRVLKTRLTFRNYFPTNWSHECYVPNPSSSASHSAMNVEELEARHRRLYDKLRAWPTSPAYKHLDITMLSLLLRLLAFSPDEEAEAWSRVAEAAQLKYASMLERYLRAMMKGDEAGVAKKLAEGLTMLSTVREIKELQRMGFGYYKLYKG